MRVIWGYANEIVLGLLAAGLLLILDSNGTIPRTKVLKWVIDFHKFLNEHLLAGTISFAAIMAIPFGLVSFAGEDLKKRILEQGAFTVFLRAYALTTGVILITYLLSFHLLPTNDRLLYAIATFLWIYSAVLIITAIANASIFIWLIEKMHRLEVEIRSGKYDM